MEQPTKTATYIDTEIFFRIVQFLKKNGWKLTAEYDPEIFDKGIDFDYYKFYKDGETIEMAWDNWGEGEIKTTDKLLEMLVLQFKTEFTFGNSDNIKKAHKIDDLIIKYK